MAFQPGQIPVGRVVGGAWRVVRPLGRATPRSALFVVEQQSTGRACALRVLDPALIAKSEGRERFTELCRLRASLRSVHVVDLLDAGVDERTKAPWFAMPLLEGPTLEERVARGALSEDDALDLLSQVAAALSAVHGASVACGRLDPASVILVEGDYAGAPFTARVLDFWTHAWLREEGVAERTAASLWMAPELIGAEGPATVAGDVWSFGLLAFYALCGRAYWRSASDGDRLKRADIDAEVRDAPLAPARERAEALGARRRLPEGFDAWFSRCVDRDPAARFESVDAAMQELDALFGGGSADETAGDAGDDETEPEEAEVIRARPRPAAPVRAVSKPSPAPAGPLLARVRRSPDVLVPVLLVALLGGALALRARVMRNRARRAAPPPVAAAPAQNSGGTVAAGTAPAQDNADLPSRTGEITDAMVTQLVESLGEGRGSPAWVTAMADDAFSVAQAERILDALRRAGWDVKPLRRTAMRLRPGYYLFAAEEQPPAYVETLASALNRAGLDPAYRQGYRAYAEEMRRTRPDFRGFAMEEGQSFVLVVGRGPAASQ